MGGFLWTTVLGLADLLILAGVCGFRLWRGPSDARAIAGILLAAFIADRINLALFPVVDGEASRALAFGACFIAFVALWASVRAARGAATWAIAVLGYGKMAISLLLGLGVMTFDTFTAIFAVIAVLQLFLLAASGPFDGLALRLGVSGTPDPRGGGNLAARLASFRHSKRAD